MQHWFRLARTAARCPRDCSSKLGERWRASGSVGSAICLLLHHPPLQLQRLPQPLPLQLPLVPPRTIKPISCCCPTRLWILPLARCSKRPHPSARRKLAGASAKRAKRSRKNRSIETKTMTRTGTRRGTGRNRASVIEGRDHAPDLTRAADRDLGRAIEIAHERGGGIDTETATTRPRHLLQQRPPPRLLHLLLPPPLLVSTSLVLVLPLVIAPRALLLAIAATAVTIRATATAIDRHGNHGLARGHEIANESDSRCCMRGARYCSALTVLLIESTNCNPARSKCLKTAAVDSSLARSLASGLHSSTGAYEERTGRGTWDRQRTHEHAKDERRTTREDAPRCA